MFHFHAFRIEKVTREPYTEKNDSNMRNSKRIRIDDPNGYVLMAVNDGMGTKNKKRLEHIPAYLLDTKNGSKKKNRRAL